MGANAKEHNYVKSLSSQQQKRLRGLAHSLKPCVLLGGSGLSEGVLGAIRNAADTHELIKVQLPGSLSAGEKTQFATELMGSLGQRFHAAGRLGRMLILYFEKDPGSAKIPLASVSKRSGPLH